LPDSSSATGFPTDQFEVELAARSVSLTLADEVYPLDAVYGASYTFIDRCYVLLDRVAPGRTRVVVTPKQGGTTETDLRAIAGELVNELLSCAWRSQIVRENRAVIEAVTMQAVGGAMGPPSLDELKDFDFSEEPFEDPLGIGLSWEDKYKKKDKDKAPAEAAAPATGEPEGTT
jgi:His-Xaa-Ser system protein HxsD